MKILLIGNGAREHAIFDALKRSHHNPEIIVFGKSRNPGMIHESYAYEVGNIENMHEVYEIGKKYKPDFAFIGPDNPIALGASDALKELGIKSVAPMKNVAQLESSKSFTRDLVAKYKIPGNPKYKIFTDYNPEEIKGYILNELNGEYVIKYDELLGGKGVKVSGEHLVNIEEALDFCKFCLEKSKKFVIEEKLIGPEFSLMAFVDGKTVRPMPIIQDHKRAYNDDTGPNTGGMGTYSDTNHLLPFLTQKDHNDAVEIIQKTLNALYEETGTFFQGIMYGGFMRTALGVKLIEFNARFGDPEAMNALPILETDFVEVCLGIINQDLENLEVKFAPKATVCLYVVPEGYPDNPIANEDDKIITVSKQKTEAQTFFASVDLIEESTTEFILKMSNSRALAFTGIADTIEGALEIAKQGLSNVKGKIAFRTDIGTAQLIQRRIDLVNSFS